MDRDRRAVVAFAVLAAVVATPIALTTGGSRSHEAPAATRASSGPSPEARDNRSDGIRRRQIERLRRQQSRYRGPEATGPVLHLPAGCGQAAPAVFPGARPARSLGNESAIRRQLNHLGRTARLTDVATFTMGRSGWLADTQTGLDVFGWYDRRMRAVQFWRMGRTLRSLIGVRPAGLVDSPPLLYVDRQAAVLVRQIGSDRMGLLVAASCAGSETV